MDKLFTLGLVAALAGCDPGLSVSYQGSVDLAYVTGAQLTTGVGGGKPIAGVVVTLCAGECGDDPITTTTDATGAWGPIEELLPDGGDVTAIVSVTATANGEVATYAATYTVDGGTSTVGQCSAYQFLPACAGYLDFTLAEPAPSGGDKLYGSEVAVFGEPLTGRTLVECAAGGFVSTDFLGHVETGMLVDGAAIDATTAAIDFVTTNVSDVEVDLDDGLALTLVDLDATGAAQLHAECAALPTP